MIFHCCPTRIAEETKSSFYEVLEGLTTLEKVPAYRSMKVHLISAKRKFAFHGYLAGARSGHARQRNT